jgi:hypothetical protein
VITINPYAHKFNIDAAGFDGASDYATRGATLTGIADSKLLSYCGWFRGVAVGGVFFANATTVGGGTVRLKIGKNGTDGSLQTWAYKSDGTLILDQSSTAFAAIGNREGWYGASFDMNDSTKTRIYWGDRSEAEVAATYSDNTIDLTVADWSVGARPDSGEKWNGGMAEFIFWPGVWIDWSVQATRRLLYSASAKPVNPTLPSGAFATLGTPSVYLHLNDGETADNFVANNDGGATGGAFTVAGALSTYASSPSD